MEPNQIIQACQNETNFDELCYLQQVLGPQRQPRNTLISLTCVYLVLAILGIFGNFSVCFVIFRIPSMRSATNYYLFSLAVSDLLILLLGLPNEVYVLWQQYPWIFGEELCKIRALVSEMTSYSSVLTIVAFSMERYLAICHPLYSYTMSGLWRASKIIAILWILALVSAIPYAVFTQVIYFTNPRTNQTIQESAFCTTVPPTFLFEASFFLFFLIPMIIMVVLYIRMGLKIRSTTRFGENSNVHGESRQAQSRKSILRMLASVVLAFFICWAPFHTQRLLYVTWKDWQFPSDDVFHLINEKLFYISGCFYYLSSTVNPILYNVMSAKYRNAFKETLCGKERINSTNATRTEAIKIQNNGLNGQNGLNRNSLNGLNRNSLKNRNNGQHQQGFQADIHRISSASEVKISETTVVLVNGAGTTRKLSQTSSLNKGSILVAENFDDKFKDIRELEMAEIHNQKLHEPCVEEYQTPKVLDKSQQTNIGDTDLNIVT